ncbi:MAG: hypothetical protein IPJ65_10040 [Archangiaceae bacterium]|nr:hypothetical protein [Archangiaceae bacterium]
MLWALAITVVTAAPSNEARAGALYEEGLKHYNVAEYEQAIDRFKQAYLLTRAPELLFNVAQAYRLWGGHCELALQSYKSYLREDPKSPKRAKVEGYVAELEKCPAPVVEPPPPAAEPTPAPVTETRVTERPFSALLVTAGGVALVASGATLMGFARKEHDGFVTSQCAPNCDAAAVNAAKTRQTVGLVLIIAGAVASVAGFGWWLFGGHEVVVSPAGVGGTF